MAKLKTKDRTRLGELRAKVLDENGDYKEDADFDDLQELAKLEATADDKPMPPVVKPEKDEVKIKPKPGIKAPKIVKKWLNMGYDYYGVDEYGAHILWNEDEGMFYRLNRDPNFVDALCEGFPDEYLESLK